MLAAISCDSTRLFDFVCRFINPHDPTGVAGAISERLLAALAVFAFVYLLGRIARGLINSALHRGSADRQVRTLLHNVLVVITFTAAILSALVVGGVDISVVLTAAGVGTIAIGLAFQDLLRNILAGIWLLLEHPFRLGDNVAVLDQSGVVQNITLRTTTLRTGDGRLAVVPNLTVFSNPVVNASTYELRQFTLTVREPSGVDLEHAMRHAGEVLRSIPEVAQRPSPSVLPQLDGEAVLLHCRYWVDQQAQDPDAVAAAVAQRLWDAQPADASEPQPR